MDRVGERFCLRNKRASHLFEKKETYTWGRGKRAGNRKQRKMGPSDPQGSLPRKTFFGKGEVSVRGKKSRGQSNLESRVNAPKSCGNAFFLLEEATGSRGASDKEKKPKARRTGRGNSL